MVSSTVLSISSNKGIEFAFNYNIIDKADLNLSFGITYNYNVNKVEEVPADANMDGEMRFASTAMNPSKPYIIREGEPVGLIIGYQADGFYKVLSVIRQMDSTRLKTST